MYAGRRGIIYKLKVWFREKLGVEYKGIIFLRGDFEDGIRDRRDFEDLLGLKYLWNLFKRDCLKKRNGDGLNLSREEAEALMRK